MAWLASNCSRWASSSLHFPCSFSSSWWCLNRTQARATNHNQHQVEVNSWHFPRCCGNENPPLNYVLEVEDSYYTSVCEETHDVLIDRVIRTCFDAFSCASRFWDFFLSWRRNQRRQHLDDLGVMKKIPPLQKLPWSVEVEPVFPISSATDQVHQILDVVTSCTFHVHFITSRFEQNTW